MQQFHWIFTSKENIAVRENWDFFKIWGQWWVCRVGFYGSLKTLILGNFRAFSRFLDPPQTPTQCPHWPKMSVDNFWLQLTSYFTLKSFKIRLKNVNFQATPHSKVFDHITYNLRYHNVCKIETTLMYTVLLFYCAKKNEEYSAASLERRVFRERSN